MSQHIAHNYSFSSASMRARIAAGTIPVLLALIFGVAASAQDPAPGTTPAQPAVQSEAAPAQPAAQSETAPAKSDEAAPQVTEKAATEKAAPAKAAGKDTASGADLAGGVTEEELKQMLVGKDLYLRGGYLGDSISFNEHGGLFGHAPFGSYTLCGVRIEKVRLEKHKLELIGARYGLHFLGAMPYEDPASAMDRVKITPKKKVLKITIDRELVVKPKKVKEPKAGKGETAKGKGKAEKPDAAPAEAATSELSEAEQAKAEIATTPAEEKPTDWASVTTTTSPAHAKQVLMDALGKVFATGLDAQMMEEMPKFWKLYYQAVQAKTDYRPADAAVLRQNTVDQKAKLLTKFEPGSNEFAQAAGVAGMSLYHVVIGADGKPQEVAVARPIGFGLDESAVSSIEKAEFAPAMKDGKPVPVLLDLVVQFRIYSKRTAVTAGPEAAAKTAGTILPGPYTVAEKQSQ